MLLATVAACGGGETFPKPSSRGPISRSSGPSRHRPASAPRPSWREAQSELTAARQAADDEDYTEARRLADQAESDATLAEARAQAAVEHQDPEPDAGHRRRPARDGGAAAADAPQ